MGSYFLNTKTNKVHYISEEKTSCRTRMLNNSNNYKEYSSLEEIKQTGRKISICNNCMYGEARDEYIKIFGNGEEEKNYTYKAEEKGFDEGLFYLIFITVSVIIFIVILSIVFRSCGDSSYEHTCDFPGCEDQAEYSTGGHKYCTEHYIIMHEPVIHY